MIFNLNEGSVDLVKEKVFDICIIGAGPAGISLALSLDRSFDILLLEAGDMEYTEESQEIYKGKNKGHEYYYLEDCRGRWFGGTANMWGGWCGTFQEYDFEKKDFIKLSGWPIGKKDLDPYIDRAKVFFGPPLDEYEPKHVKENAIKGWDDILSAKNEYIRGSSDTFWTVDPSYFVRVNGEKVKKSTNIFCYLNANVTDMRLDDKTSTVTSVQVQNYNGHTYYACAETVVLATGGIENPRLLLNMNHQLKNGIGNDHDMVGRCFNDHPAPKVGYYILEDWLIDEAKKLGKSFNRKMVVGTRKLIFEEKLLHDRIKVTAKKTEEMDRARRGFRGRIKDIICTSDWLLSLYGKIKKYKIECYGSDYDVSDGVLRTSMECALNPKSRITLGEDVDRFCLKRVVLNWQGGAIDKHSVKRTVEHFAELMAEKAIGRVKIDRWLLEDEVKDWPGFPERQGGPHHLCTTRMSNSPKEGVVDSNLKVFGIDNLYIAGSSVFSTGGYMNPTFQIVQLSIRLAEYLSMEKDNKKTLS